jgi:surface antigen
MESVMSLLKGVSAVLVSLLLALPLAAHADRDKGQDNGYDGCSEHKGKSKCHGGNRHKNKQGERHAAGGPPSWAPAHGWRRNNDGAARNYNAAKYDDEFIEERSGARVVVSSGNATVDVGIERGTCNREAIGTVVGGIIGGVVGNRVGEKAHRDVATVLGVVIGGMVGHNIGRTMDKSDQHCTGQVLEQAPDHHTVRWTDQASRGEYRVTPERTYQADGADCRDYITEYQGPTGTERERSSACRNPEGAWQKVAM